MDEHTVSGVGPDRIDIAYERRGDPADPVVLLVMRLAAQSVNRPDGFCDALVERGLQIIRFDNRDRGRSTHMVDAPAHDLTAALGGDLSSASYTLSDMAADAAGLLEALHVPAAHVVGVSMGGEIAQAMAIEHRERVRSLTSIMSATGAPAAGRPGARRDRGVVRRPARRDARAGRRAGGAGNVGRRIARLPDP